MEITREQCSLWPALSETQLLPLARLPLLSAGELYSSGLHDSRIASPAYDTRSRAARIIQI